MMKRITISIILICFLTSCSPPESIAGAWEASTEYGDFTVYVNEEENAITQIDYEFVCGGVEASAYNQPFSKPSETINGRKLSIYVSYSFMKMLEIDGSFSSNGKKLSGTVSFMPQEISGGCTADFSVSR